MKRRKKVLSKWSVVGQVLASRRLNLQGDGILYRFDSVSKRRLKNWFLAEVSARFRLARPLALPTHLQVEPTNRCNLRCSVCPTTTGEMNRPRGSMDPASFERLMASIGEDLLLILLWQWGEPFLNDDVCHLITSAKKRGVKVVTSTNGHFIQDSASARRIVDSGLDTLVFAVDGATPDTYQVFRRGGDFERVREAIRVMAETKKAMGSETPVIDIQCIVMRQNEGQIGEMIDLAKGLGADVVALRTANTANPHRNGSEEAFLPLDHNYRQFDYDASTSRRIRKPNRCKRLWNNPGIQWDGRVTHCDYDLNGDFELGNAFQTDFHDIWLGERYVALRRAFAANRPLTRPCHECMYNFSSFRDIVAEMVPLTDSLPSTMAVRW